MTTLTQNEMFISRAEAMTRSNKETIFAVMRYPKVEEVPERTLFKILLGKDAQFTAEVVGGNLAQTLHESGKAELLFAGLFTKITGDITMHQIMHDAARDPSAAGLGKFRFRLRPGSLYGNNPPIGLNGGKISLYVLTSNSMWIATHDTRKDVGISGVYGLTLTDEKRMDAKNREATLVRMMRAQEF